MPARTPVETGIAWGAPPPVERIATVPSSHGGRAASVCAPATAQAAAWPTTPAGATDVCRARGRGVRAACSSMKARRSSGRSRCGWWPIPAHTSTCALRAARAAAPRRGRSARARRGRPRARRPGPRSRARGGRTRAASARPRRPPRWRRGRRARTEGAAAQPAHEVARRQAAVGDEGRVGGGDVERADERERQRGLGHVLHAGERERLGQPDVPEADRGQQREAAHQVGPLGHRRGDGAAERVPDQGRALQPHPPERRGDVVGVGADPGRASADRSRRTRAGRSRCTGAACRAASCGPAGGVVEEPVQQDERPPAARPGPDPQPAPVRQRHVPHQVLELLQGGVSLPDRAAERQALGGPARLRRSRARVARSRCAAVAGADGLSSRALRNFARSSSVILRTDKEPSSICSCMRSSFACRQASSRSRCVFGGMPLGYPPRARGKLGVRLARGSRAFLRLDVAALAALDRVLPPLRRVLPGREALLVAIELVVGQAAVVELGPRLVQLGLGPGLLGVGLGGARLGLGVAGLELALLGLGAVPRRRPRGGGLPAGARWAFARMRGRSRASAMSTSSTTMTTMTIAVFTAAPSRDSEGELPRPAEATPAGARPDAGPGARG